jgi:hypothetical protein
LRLVRRRDRTFAAFWTTEGGKREGAEIMTLFIVCFVLLVLLVGFAIQKRGFVRASFNFRAIGFSLEAKDKGSKNTVPGS